MAEAFQSPEEFQEVVEKAFRIMSEDEEMGPRLKAADTAQRFEFTDVGLVAHLRPTRGEEEGNLIWKWGEAEWEPRVRMTMDSGTLNQYFLGNENIAVAIASKRIKTGGDVKAALAILPLTQPLFGRYRELVAAEYPHLAK
jgi:SCP-2 sterol transfer family